VTIRHPLDPVALTRTLVAIDSRNPSLVDGAPGEGRVAACLAEILSGWGFTVELREVAPGRPNVIARVGPAGCTPLVLNGHLDVVGTDGMTHPPFQPHEADGRLYGRGANDMKGGVAAMCVAAARVAARGELVSEVIVTAVCDEEYRSLGTSALLAGGLQATAAIVTEPTRLAICPAHKGFVWFDVAVTGHAAHGSRPDVGVDAIAHAGLLLGTMLAHGEDTLGARRHPLLGAPSLHAATITGGTGWSTYPSHCALQVERRTIPGETGDQVRRELQQLIDELARTRRAFSATLTLHTEQPPNDVPVHAPIVHALRDALCEAALPPSIDGLSCWTDAALFTAAGIPAVCFGPGDIARAHAAEEWIGIDELHHATTVLESVLRAWGAP
jgi:acetylornithine deacetylase